MTVEQQLREYIEAHVEHIDLEDITCPAFVPASSGNQARRHPMLVAAAAAVVLGGVGLAMFPRANDRTDTIASRPTDTASASAPTSDPTATTSSTQESGAPQAATPPAAVTILPDAPRQQNAVTTLFALSDQLANARTVSFKAIDLQVQECLNLLGVHDTPTPTFLTSGYHASAADLIWAWPNQQEATAAGYLRPNDQSDSAQDPGLVTGTPANDALYGKVIGTWEADPAQVKPGFAVGGDIYDGCLPQAQTEILGGGDPIAAYRITDYDYQLQAVVVPALRHVQAADDYVAAAESWIACMGQGGYDVTGPADPLALTWPNPRPTSAEVEMASVDAACKVSSGLADVGNRLFNDEITNWLIANPEAPAEIESYVSDVLERSEAVLRNASRTTSDLPGE